MSGSIDRYAFWQLIDQIDREALDDGNEDAAVEPLIRALTAWTESEIASFEDHLAYVLYDLDGQRYADEAGPSGKSGDGFLYARCYVVAKGHDYYDSVRANPKNMPKRLEQWCESLLYVPQRSWAIVTERDENEWNRVTPVSYETGSNYLQWK
jgi:hypothetical protein